jgi:hypothetical protein
MQAGGLAEERRSNVVAPVSSQHLPQGACCCAGDLQRCVPGAGSLVFGWLVALMLVLRRLNLDWILLLPLAVHVQSAAARVCGAGAFAMSSMSHCVAMTLGNVWSSDSLTTMGG